jgi:hypothetical protein
MKVIGAEFRMKEWSSIHGASCAIEATIVPLNLDFPYDRAEPHKRRYVEITLHTTFGDRTVEIELPYGASEGSDHPFGDLIQRAQNAQ